MSGKKYVLIIFVLSLLGAAYAIIYQEIGENELARWEKKYVYNADAPPNNIVMYIRKLKYKEQYFRYVNDDMTKKGKISVNFPTDNRLPDNTIIYIRRYLSDSKLVEFYNPKYHNKIWGFTTGYIDRVYIHDTLKNK